MTVETGLIALGTVKSDIKTALTNKGADMSTASFTDYASKIDDLVLGGGDTPPVYTDRWVKPNDWLNLPSVAYTEEKFVGLIAIFADDLNPLRIKCRGAYTIDWGDGLVENQIDNADVTHNYDFTNTALDGTLTSGGYKQAIVTITPQSGQNLTVCQIAWGQSVYTPWLNATMNGPNCISFGFSGAILLQHCSIQRDASTSAASKFNSCGSLVSVTELDTHNCYNFDYMFYVCYSIQYIPLFDTTHMNSSYSMFQSCQALRSIPYMDTSRCTTFGNMFSGCNSLIGLPDLDTTACKLFNYAFNGCTKLRSIPHLNTTGATTFSAMFSGCSSLTTIPLLDMSSVTTAGSMFTGCLSLETIPALDMSSITSCNQMFYNCGNLENLPTLNTVNVIDFSSMFTNCMSINYAPQINTINGTNFSNMFSGCFSLVEVPDLNTSKGTNFSAMFAACRTLTNPPAMDTSIGTLFQSIFSGCYVIRKLPAYNFSNATNVVSAFDTSYLVNRVLITGIKLSINLKNAKMQVSALVELFNNLGTASGSQSVTISGNPGAAGLSAPQRAIATGKGLTIVG